MKNPRERGREKERDKEEEGRREREMECKRQEPEFSRCLLSMTTMRRSVLFVCGLKQTSDC